MAIMSHNTPALPAATINRRALLGVVPTAVAAPLALATAPASAATDTATTPRDRLAFIAETLGIPMPAGLPSNLEDRDGCPCVEVLAFCGETGASLDFIYLGSIRALIRGDYYRHKAAAGTPVAQLFREWTTAKAIEERAYQESEDDAEDCPAWAARWEVEKRLMAAPSQNAQDWLIKVMAWTNCGEGVSLGKHQNPQLWAEARALIGGA